MAQQRTPNPHFTFDLSATADFAATLIPLGRSVRAAWYEAASHRRWLARQIGPRQVGGIYRTGYSGDVYEVLEIDHGPRSQWPVTWQITVRTVGTDHVRRHCTAWEDRDQVLAEPGPLADVVRAAFTTPVSPAALIEQGHLLDEATHPRLTAALQRLAPA
ncbi:hypothetical protein [Streptacidiphilus anmyonensis]|uniref:hypothetical protein n=1 Tax=Streptacidiphilus anmyonensis TaxID=405782 RepID=UPI0005A80232|nr:hypothetical protein [Streptacidiphilus anmyonensis]